MSKFWADVPEAEWHEVVRMMGLPTSTGGVGASDAEWFIARLSRQGEAANDPFTDYEIEFLRRHTFSVDPVDTSAIAALQEKVSRHARTALRQDLDKGGPITKVGVFAKWPTDWYDHYRQLIESMNPTMISGVLQNVLAPDGELWKP